MSKTFPLHADTVGSYLRSEPLKAARADFAAGKMSREQLTQTGFYADKQSYYEDVRQAYKEAIQVFYDAGCRYLQFDDVYWGTLCNHYDKPDFAENKRYALENIQDILSVKPADMTITTHVCRGNYKSSYLFTGNYVRWRKICSAKPLMTAISWNMIMSAAAALNR